jgi:hypothetical protein
MRIYKTERGGGYCLEEGKGNEIEMIWNMKSKTECWENTREKMNYEEDD